MSENRSGNYKGESYDFILGPVANDDVYRTFTLYTAGLLTKEQTLEALKVKKLYDQLVFSTETALSYVYAAPRPCLRHGPRSFAPHQSPSVTAVSLRLGHAAAGRRFGRGLFTLLFSTNGNFPKNL